MNVFDSPERRAQEGGALRRCRGACGGMLPLSEFSIERRRTDGRRPECKTCRRRTRGPRGRERQQARWLGETLESLSARAATPALKEVLQRAVIELGQIADARDVEAQVAQVRHSVLVQGCREIVEIIEETRLSRFAVERALARLVSNRIVEVRNRYEHIVEDEEGGAGAPPAEYHPCDTPAGDSFFALRHASPELPDLPV